MPKTIEIPPTASRTESARTTRIGTNRGGGAVGCHDSALITVRSLGRHVQKKLPDDLNYALLIHMPVVFQRALTGIVSHFPAPVRIGTQVFELFNDGAGIPDRHS